MYISSVFYANKEKALKKTVVTNKFIHKKLIQVEKSRVKMRKYSRVNGVTVSS